MANLTDEEIFQLLDNSDIEIDFSDDSDADPDWIVEPAERIGAELQSTIVVSYPFYKQDLIKSIFLLFFV